MENTIQLHDKKFRIMIPAVQIDKAVDAVAQRINADYAGKETPLFLGILNGSFMFMSDLIKKIEFQNELSFVKLASYDGTCSTGCVKSLIGLNNPIEGRHVIIVEDIVDTGESIEHMIKELEARNEVKWETYTKKIQIEARVMGDLTMNHIIPVATHYQSMLLKNVQSMRAVFPAEKAEKLSSRNMKIIEDIAERTQAIEQGVEELVNARKVANRIADEREKAVAYHDTVVPKMEAIRYHIDKLELCVSDELWTQPKYRELLFIR